MGEINQKACFIACFVLLGIIIIILSFLAGTIGLIHLIVSNPQTYTILPSREFNIEVAKNVATILAESQKANNGATGTNPA